LDLMIRSLLDRAQRSLHARLLPLLGLLALTACPSQPNYPECKNDVACKAHAQICVNGFCRQCREDAQCKAGQACVNGGCFAKPECSAEIACAAGLVCRDNKCAPECSAATSASDCGSGRKCVESRCVADEECSGDDECGSGKACVESHCRAQGQLAAGESAKLSCAAGPIYFSYDDASLDTRAREALTAAWQCVTHEGYRRIILSGSTDERGTTEYNLALGSRRAEVVRKYFVGLGGDGRKLRTVSFGKEKPADVAHDEGAWARNRRVDIELQK
jgi:peptidoglycan-associated lipoprotein